ncbi:hypothetical protein [Streptomyces sp. WG5]|uniref:hypothetical protein n=1 Tax=Streptomyces sp. WG5 TaxID=3417648 RepID=UPI003CF068AD
MDENLNRQFDELTESMALEKLYDQLSSRAEFVRMIALHCASLHKTAVAAGLPKGVAERMALKFFDSEVTPPGMTVIQLDERDETL